MPAQRQERRCGLGAVPLRPLVRCDKLPVTWPDDRAYAKGGRRTPRMGAIGHDDDGTNPRTGGSGGLYRVGARMVRLFSLRHRRGPGVRPAVLSEKRPSCRHPTVVSDFRCGFRCPSTRRYLFRHLGRPAGTQAGSGGDAANDWRRHHPDRCVADLFRHRRMGASPAGGFACASRPGRRRQSMAGRSFSSSNTRHQVDAAFGAASHRWASRSGICWPPALSRW